MKLSLHEKLDNWMRRRQLARPGVRFLGRAIVDRHVDIDLGDRWGKRGSITLGDFTHLSTGAILHCYGGAIEVGENVFIGPYAVIYGHGGVRIGSGTLIAMHCRIVAAEHTIPSPDAKIRDHADRLLPVDIGSDVWLGAGVTVTGGVHIGDGCVVGAGAVVTSDLPAYSIAVGIPAHVVGHRE